MILIARSSTQKLGIQVITGLIDPDFVGEASIQIYNMTDVDITIEAGSRIAQGMIMPVEHVNIVQVEELSPTERGSAGFGEFSGA